MKDITSIKGYFETPVLFHTIPNINLEIATPIYNLYFEFPEIINLFKHFKNINKKLQKWNIFFNEEKYILVCYDTIYNSETINIPLNRIFEYKQFTMKIISNKIFIENLNNIKDVSEIDQYDQYPPQYKYMKNSYISISKALFNLFEEYPEINSLFQLMNKYKNNWYVTSYDNIIYCHNITDNIDLEIKLNRNFIYDNFILKKDLSGFSFENEVFYL